MDPSQPRRGRIEDRRFVTGEGRFAADLVRPGLVHGVVVRSPHAHADIARIDAAAALAAPGVLAVVTAADLAADGVGPLQNTSSIPSDPPLVRPPRPVLAADRVRCQGEPVAFVVAETLAAALDAAELVVVDYAERPAVVDAAAALAPGAPQIWDTAPGNVACVFRAGDRAAAETALAAADHVLELEVDNHRVCALPLEPRAAIGEFDVVSDTLVLTATAQGVHGVRDALARTFGVDKARLQVVAHDVGGGFGAKNFAYPEWALVLHAARRLGRPVKWVAERVEELTGGAHGRAVRSRAKLGVTADGRITAILAEMTADLGAHLSTGAPGSGTVSVTRAIHGMYAIPAVFMETTGVFTNTAPVDAYRGAGKPEGNYLVERLIDTAARRFDFDPVEIRRKNAIADFPYHTPLGFTVDSGQFAGIVEKAAALADRDGFKARQAAAARDGKLLGQGFGCFLESARGAPSEGAEIRFAGDGMLELRVGTESNGQGHETTFTQLVSERFGLATETVRYIQADTRETRMGNGHGGARSMHMGGTAIVRAIGTVLAKGGRVAADLLQAPEGQVIFRDGAFIAGDGRSVALADVAAAARQPEFGLENGLDSFERFDDAPITWPVGCHVAEVEIDADTGAVRLLKYAGVDDYGAILNPQLIEGQVHGGLAQGIGQALGEAIVYDETGQCLSATLMDYPVPYADGLPAFDIRFDGLPTQVNPLGVKGSGQAGAIAASQTVMNAVTDALARVGAGPIDMPATPEKVWRALRAARG
ncbi:MAG: xanthine dehydrogenase family protein molybdopterin-binding subunit [Gammaproteobacteria bacterium]|nr:xanthine dehydrogenase family protein molybdopterin-binding subunit [Gammaproteobacteria bacterium]